MATKIIEIQKLEFGKIVTYEGAEYHGQPSLYFVTDPVEIVGRGAFNTCSNGKVRVRLFVKNDKMPKPQTVVAFVSDEMARKLASGAKVRLCGRYLPAGEIRDADGEPVTNLLGVPLKRNAEFRVRGDEDVMIIVPAPEKKVQVQVPEFSGEELLAAAQPKKASKAKKAMAKA